MHHRRIITCIALIVQQHLLLRTAVAFTERLTASENTAAVQKLRSLLLLRATGASLAHVTIEGSSFPCCFRARAQFVCPFPSHPFRTCVKACALCRTLAGIPRGLSCAPLKNLTRRGHLQRLLLRLDLRLLAPRWHCPHDSASHSLPPSRATVVCV